MKISFKPTLLLIALVSTLIACQGEPPKPAETIFKPENAWNGAVPSDAKMIPKEEFAALVASGALVIESSASLAARNALLQKQYEDNKTFLQNTPNKTSGLQALLDEAATQPNRDGNRITPGANSQVLFGVSTQLQEAVEIYQRSQSTDNALADYTLSYALLPTNLQSTLPTPNDLKGKKVTEINVALVNLNKALAGQPILNSARLETGGATVRTQDIRAGNGTDNNGGPCTPTNYVANYWFPLKNFVSEIKNQANRGSCWAFTALGAIESRERVQNNNATNLSEQFLVNKVKEDWDSSKYSDGYNTDKALETAVNKGQSFPPESSWTYNPAYGRPNVKDDEDSYADTCTKSILEEGSDKRKPYTGTCSNTSHQSERVCTDLGLFDVCSYRTVTFKESGIPSSRTIQVWQSGQSFDLNRYINYLSAGHVLMASFPVYKGFLNDVLGTDDKTGKAGIVSNYATTKFDGNNKEIPGSYGGHAVQIVGFLSNDVLAGRSGKPSNVGGGGYFIVKNSWGCVADGGYYYVPAFYVDTLFKSLSILNFDARRSQAWNTEQATPGGAIAPTITIKANPAFIDVRASVPISSLIAISHPIAKSVDVIVESPKSGDGKTLYQAPWKTDETQVVIPPNETFSFSKPEQRTINVVARYGTTEARATFVLNIINTAPTLSVQATGDPRQNEPYALTAVVSDINEANTNFLCTNTTWSVDAPDTIQAGTGCLKTVTFGSIGVRQVRVTTTDSDGLSTSKTTDFTVLAPSVNPFPKIAGGQVRSSERGDRCGSVAVADLATIDLTNQGCVGFVGQPIPFRYSATVTIENPSAEALTYDWNLFVTRDGVETAVNFAIGTTSTSFEVKSAFNSGLRTDPCRVVVTVNAPDAARNKTQTIWTGTCSYPFFSIN